MDLAPASGTGGQASGFVTVTVTFPAAAKSPTPTTIVSFLQSAFVELLGS